MNTYSFFYLGAIIVALILYMVSKKLTTAQTVHTTKALKESYTRYEGGSDHLANTILKNADWFAPIAQRLTNEIILGIAECLPMKRLEDWVKKTAFNQAGRSIGKVTGVRIKQTEAPFTYYLVLTAKHLHYMAYEEGHCKEHVYFERSALLQLKWQEITYQDVLIHEGLASSGNCYKLNFLSNNKSYTIIVNPLITRSPYQEMLSDESISLPLFVIRKAFQKQLLENVV